MFVNFDRVFNKSPEAQITNIPPALVEYLNKSLPEGLKYTVDEEGYCSITSEETEITVGGITFDLTDEQKEILGKQYTASDVCKFFYNIQKPIPLKLHKEGFILLNGVEFPIEKCVYNPLNPIKFVSGSLFSFPKPFPEPFKISIGGNGYEREITVSRVANNSVHVSAFQSDNEEPLVIKYWLDDSQNSFSFNISLNIEYAQNVKDIVESVSIYNAFIDGQGFLNGNSLLANVTSENAKKYDEKSIEFWKRVLRIEEIIDVSFVPPNEELSFDSICLVEQLFQSLVNYIPTRDKQNIESISGELKDGEKIEDMKVSVNQPMFFEFEATTKLSLFDTEIELPAIIGVCDAVISNCESSEDGSKYTIFFSDESNDKKKYTAVLFFKSDDELQKYRASKGKEIIDLFCNSKKPSEYLS